MMLHRCVHVHVDAETARVVAAARAPDTALAYWRLAQVYVPELFPRVVVVTSTTRRHQGIKDLKLNSLRVNTKERSANNHV